MRRFAPEPLRITRSLLAADHLLLFRRTTSGATTLVIADPPQLPSHAFAFADDTWPGGEELYSSVDVELQRSPIGQILAGVRGTMLAVSASGPLQGEDHHADDADHALYVLWLSPRQPPEHVQRNPAAVAPALRAQLDAIQSFAENVRARARLDVLLSALPHGVILTDEDAGTALVNTAASQLLDIDEGTMSAPALADAMSAVQQRMVDPGQVAADGRVLFATGDAVRINWIWELMLPLRRTLLVSTLPVRSSMHRGRLWSFHEVTALRAAEAEQVRLVRELERERTRVADMLAHAPAMIFLLRGADHIVEFANETVLRHTGGHDPVGHKLFAEELVELRGGELHQAHDSVFATGQPWVGTAIAVPAIDANGARHQIFINLSLQPLVDADGHVTGIFSHAVDVTMQVNTLEQLRQSQKMEAMGRLAGGVAHDFNNLLTVIGGNTELLLADLAPATQAHADASEVQRAVERAAGLTRQLLLFSRRQVLQKHVIELDAVVRGVEKLLRRVIGEDILLETTLGVRSGTILGDPGLLEQVLVNLAVNARDAMPEGGRLHIKTQRSYDPLPGSIEPEIARRLTGAHVRISVEDTGVGMDAATIRRAFEPFFTTKPEGKGTGLGLATVFGIVEQSGGALWIDSTVNAGTTMWIALPLSTAPLSVTLKSTPTYAVGTGGTVLLVEDEAGVRHIAQRILEEAGYHVIVAVSGADALRQWHSPGDGVQHRVDLLLTDIVMPEVGGRSLVRALRATNPQLPVLFISGYVEGGLSDDELAGPTAFLAKPFLREDLLREVAQLLAVTV